MYLQYLLLSIFPFFNCMGFLFSFFRCCSICITKGHIIIIFKFLDFIEQTYFITYHFKPSKTKSINNWRMTRQPAFFMPFSNIFLGWSSYTRFWFINFYFKIDFPMISYTLVKYLALTFLIFCFYCKI